MRSIKAAVSCGLLVSFATACGGAESGFSAAEWAEIERLSPLPPLAPDTTNRYADDPAAAALGQQFFFDRRYSGPIVVGDDGENGGLGEVGESGRLSCRDCHLAEWMIDNRSRPNNTSLGVDWYFRNAPTIVNVATYDEWFGWAGVNDNLWGKNLTPAEFIMGTTRTGIARFIQANYEDEYNAVFSPAIDPALADTERFPPGATPLAPDSGWDAMTPDDRDLVNRAYANFGKALAAYERLLVAPEAPFDRFVAGDDLAIGEAARRGLKLFIGKAACVACHEGATFSDEEFHVTGVAQIGEHVLESDGGRWDAIPIYLGWDFNTAGPYSDDPGIDRTVGVAADDALIGAFRTKGLRNVTETAPYMHTGHLQTLREVVEFYNRGGDDSGFAGTRDPAMQPLDLDDGEIDDLVAFLETLTGDPLPPELLTDTSKQ